MSFVGVNVVALKEHLGLETVEHRGIRSCKMPTHGMNKTTWERMK